MKAIVIKSTGSWYKLKLDNQRILNAIIKGKIRLKELNVTNPVAVGDIVTFELENTGDVENGMITAIEPRHNYLIRKSNKLSKQGQIIASNLDRALLVVTLSSPTTSLGFIDRFLVMAGAFHVPVSLIFNKVDLYTEHEKTMFKYLKNLYEPLGYPCLQTSINIPEMNAQKVLLEHISNQKVLISGHSGVGKSTILNEMFPDAKQKTDLISTQHLRGKHTTTFAEMFFINEQTAVIDTPGIRDFGIIDVEKTEIGHYFPEIRELMKQCKFNNCVHQNEPECAVIKAFETEQMAGSRYYNYLSILENNDVFD